MRILPYAKHARYTHDKRQTLTLKSTLSLCSPTSSFFSPRPYITYLFKAAKKLSSLDNCPSTHHRLPPYIASTVVNPLAVQNSVRNPLAGQIGS